MAAGNLSVVAARILKLLDSEEKMEAIGSLSGMQQIHLQPLKEPIQELHSVLLDAEKKSQRDIYVKDWLMQLENVLYDADNLLDDFSTEAVRRSLLAKNKTNKQVRNDFLFSTSMLKNMREEISKVKSAIDDIATEKEEFDLEVSSEKDVVMKPDERSGNQTRSSIEEGVLRKNEKMEIIKILLHTEYKENVEVLPVVGKAGLGKTMLAKEVFDDEKVQSHFDVRGWVTVSEIFDVEHISREILVSVKHGGKVEDLPNNHQKSHKVLKGSLSGKRYLIVLNDLRNEDPEKWESLKSTLKVGAKGSKILVTTRSETVASLVKGTIRSYPLSSLNEKQSWILFKRIAFGSQVQESKNKDRSYQIHVGMEIIQRCAGHPVVITAVASMLRSESIEQWHSFYKNEISKIGDSYDQFPSGFTNSSDHNEILRLLKLCYDHLPSPLKHCFAYCSLFPKGHEIDVQTLIKLWMAQGFIIDQADKSLEDVGYEYFLILLERYFFQEVGRDATKLVTKCKMHNLMHDLAMSVAGDKCILLSSSNDYTSNGRTFHVWFDYDLSSTEEIGLFDAKKTRSIVFSGQSRRRYRGIPVNTIFEKITYRFRFLRALDMHASGIEAVPNSIGKLRLLQYLDLSENEDIKELPISITELLNLQTLRLSSCFKLKTLPGDFSNLVNLRHLEIDGCNNLTSLPLGIRQLKNLKALSQLVVSEDSSMPNVVVKKLQDLKELIEKFHIRNLRLNLRHEKYVDTYLKAVPSGIRSLSLEREVHELESVSEQSYRNSNLSLDLEELSINGFRRVPDFHFPSNLVKLSLRRCANCKNLPSVHQLPSLKVLILDEMTNLEYILEGDSSSSSTTVFSTLEELWLTELPNLQGWWKNTVDELPSFLCLSKLVIEDCPKLVSMPLFPNLEEGLVLDRTSWKLFEMTMIQSTAAQEGPSSSSSSTSPPAPPPLSNLKTLRIVGIKNWEADKIKWETLKSLQFLRFDCLPKLENLPDGLKEVTSLQELHVWRCGIKKIPDWIDELQKLEKLVIRICPLLKELPEEICRLPCLRTLEIEDCNTLLRRCEQDIGADWLKIANIPRRKLGLISRR